MTVLEPGLAAHGVGADARSDDWPVALRAVLEDESRLRLVFQPIVDLARGVVAGYEALSRFTAPDGTPSPRRPDEWFTAAGLHGVGARLEAVAVRRALQLRGTLPPGTFLTLNVSPQHLTAPEIADPLLDAGRLNLLVLELTEHEAVTDVAPLLALRAELIDRGALFAVDDTGSGYSGLQQLMQFRPQLIKLDRELVADADTDEVKVALAQVLGEFGDRIDAWLLAEGIETWGELDAFTRIGVPLGQGYLLGRPSEGFQQLDPSIATRLRRRAIHTVDPDTVSALTDALPPQAPPPGAWGVRLDRDHRPVRLLAPRRTAPGHDEVRVTLRATLTTPVADLARRVATRPPQSRFDPVVVVDEQGAAVGLVRVERLLLSLAEKQIPQNRAGTVRPARGPSGPERREAP